jgi:MFS transporter, DHA1 family, inner membrane transport protein
LATVGLIANGASNVATVVLLTHAAPTARATTLTVNGSAMSLGSALGGALGGLLLATGGYGLVGIGTLVLGISSAVIVAWASRASTASTSTAAVSAVA